MMDYKKGLVSQLKNMLTNHYDRPKRKLEIRLVNKKDNTLIDSGVFDFYSNHPINKVKEKINKLRTEGDYYTLEIKELIEKSKGEYFLILAV